MRKATTKYTKSTKECRTSLSCTFVLFVVNTFEKKETTKYTKYTKECSDGFPSTLSRPFAPFVVDVFQEKAEPEDRSDRRRSAAYRDLPETDHAVLNAFPIRSTSDFLIPNAFARSRHVDVTSRIDSRIELASGLESLKYGATDKANPKSKEASCSSMASERPAEPGEGFMS